VTEQVEKGLSAPSIRRHAVQLFSDPIGRLRRTGTPPVAHDTLVYRKPEENGRQGIGIAPEEVTEPGIVLIGVWEGDVGEL
jgi:hypothetical protein